MRLDRGTRRPSRWPTWSSSTTGPGSRRTRTSRTWPRWPQTCGPAAGCRLRIEYRSSEEAAPTWRTVDPYGLLAKAGRWYLVADQAGDPRLFALARLRSWQPLDRPRRLRAGETLASVSGALTDRVEQPGGVVVTATIAASRLDLARRILGSRMVGSRPHAPDRARITVVYDQIEAVRQLLQFGDHLHVTGPPEAQALLRTVALATAELYGPAGRPPADPRWRSSDRQDRSEERNLGAATPPRRRGT